MLNNEDYTVRLAQYPKGEGDRLIADYKKIQRTDKHYKVDPNKMTVKQKVVVGLAAAGVILLFAGGSGALAPERGEVDLETIAEKQATLTPEQLAEKEALDAQYAEEELENLGLGKSR